MRYHTKLIGEGEDANDFVLDEDGNRVALVFGGEQEALHVCRALNEEDDATLVLNAMVKKSADTIEALGLSVVVDQGSLKSDEAWGGFDILAGEIRRLRQTLALVEHLHTPDLGAATWPGKDK